MRWLTLRLIRLYQNTLSLDHGPFQYLFPGGYCRFYPSCSEYGYRAIDRFGFIKGTALTVWRILRCNPWSGGGVDDPCQDKN